MAKKQASAIEKHALRYLHVLVYLEQKYMSASDVITLLGITEMQLQYWSKKGLTITKVEDGSRAWKRFSALDLFAFGVVGILRKCRIKLNQCKTVVDRLRSYLYDSTALLTSFANAEFVYLKIKGNDVKLMCLPQQIAVTDPMKLGKTREPITIALHTILSHVLDNTKHPDLRIHHRKDPTGKDKVVFEVSGDFIELG